jgi:hypothetical protein
MRRFFLEQIQQGEDCLSRGMYFLFRNILFFRIYQNLNR